MSSRKKALALVCPLLILALLVGCSSQTPAKPAAPAAPAAPQPAAKAEVPAKQAAAPAKTAAPVSKIKVRVAYPGPPESKDYPSVLAFKSLPQDKYDLQIIQAGGIVASGGAPISGQAEFGSASVNLTLNAILKGANVKIAANNYGNTWRLMGPKSIASAQDLEGKPIGLGAVGTDIDMLYNAVVRDKLKVKPNIIRTASSSDRVQAVLSGVFFASDGTGEDFMFLEDKKPGQFHSIVLYGKEMPGSPIGGSFFAVNGDFVAKNPQAMEEIMEALMKTYRRVVDDKAWFLAELKKEFGKEQSDARLQAATNDSYELKLWDGNNYMGRDVLQAMHDFYFNQKGISEKMPMEKWAAPQFAEAAVKKLGKR